MIVYTKKIFLFFFIFGFISIRAQDYVAPLMRNPNLNREIPNQLKSKRTDNYQFIFPTKTLPFVDDFSSDKTRPFSLKPFVGNRFYSFGTCNETLKYTSASYSFSSQIGKIYTCNVATNTIDSSIIIPQIAVRTFSNTNCNLISNSTNFTPAFYRYTWDITNCNKLDSTLIFDTVINAAFVEEVTLNNVLWTDNDAYINRHFPYFPPTLGVATLDGLDLYGRPYTPKSNNALQIADKLTSVPINISTFSRLDSILLSFFVEEQGYGDYPNSKDTLLLQFKDTTGKWNTVWHLLPSGGRKELDDNLSFKQFFVSIPDEIIPGDPFYYHNNFQFRFINYASTMGNNDHWHIDYVRFDKGRTNTDTTIFDIAFQYDLPTPLKNYTLLPAKQFRGAIDLKDTLFAFNNNNDATLTPVMDYVIKVDNLNTNLNLYTSNTVPFIAAKNFSISSGVNVFNIPNSISDSTTLSFKYYTLQGDNIITNDTAQHKQLFFNEIAYDDGTAEMAYGIQGFGLKKVAMKYVIPFQDTLAAIKIMFSNINEDVSNLIFNLQVWSKIDIYSNKETVLKTINNKKPIYVDTMNHFAIFGLDTPVIVKDSFYIGWVQSDERNLQIGYDRNHPNGIEKMLIFTDNNWKLTSVILPGSPMIRAILDGTRDYSAIDSNENNIAENQKLESILVYPNPFIDQIQIQFENDFKSIYSIFDLNGRLHHSGTLNRKENTIEVSNLSQGWYLLKIQTENQTITKKIYKNNN